MKFKIKQFALTKDEMGKISAFCKGRGLKGDKLITCIYSTVGSIRRGKSLDELKRIKSELMEFSYDDKNFVERFMQWLQRIRG